MSRSFKKAFYTISKRMTDNVHSAARHIVKQKLHSLDVENSDDNDLLRIEADCRELGLEDLGTKLGLEFDCEEEWKDAQSEARRK